MTAVAESACERCGEVVRKDGLRRHQRTKSCNAMAERKRLHAKGYRGLGWRAVEARQLGIPVEAARTVKRGGSFPVMNWAPWWVDLVLNNWPGSDRHRLEHPLLVAFARKLLEPMTNDAFQCLVDTWERENVSVTEGMIVAFARAAVGTADADADIASALQALQRALALRAAL